VDARNTDLHTVYKLCSAPATLHDIHNRIISVVLCALSLNMTKRLYPSIVIQPDAQYLKFILFWNNTLHVSEGLSVHHQESKTVHTASGIYRAGAVDVC
jgi:hypothetical protein